jgi:hypothetical protein
MNLPSPSRLDAYRMALEFIFWACREILKLALFGALTTYCIVSLVQGELPWVSEFLSILSRLLEH